MVNSDRVALLFGNQLFDPRHLRRRRVRSVVMVEDAEMCRRYAFHKQKLAFLLAAMRNHADALRAAGCDVHYAKLDEATTWQQVLSGLGDRRPFHTLCHFEVENGAQQAALRRYADQRGLRLETWRSPMFLNTLEDFSQFLEDRGAPSLLPYYQRQRRHHNILMSSGGEPIGGRWTFDLDNRARLPLDVNPPDPATPPETRHTRAVGALVEAEFSEHPGRLDRLWVPTTAQQACDWLDEFLEQRLRDFGRYEDALTRRSNFVFHSGLSPLLNVGLLTPEQVLDRTLTYASLHQSPINSVEGLVRQLVGWREFVRGIYHHYGEPMQRRNIWDADRTLTDAWYQGETGIAPLDHVIRKTIDLGWAHHIERLMLAANLMNLSGIRPPDVYRWFMEMFIDAYDWVMVPNVFGMGLTSEGGIFTTKPYICGSNYVLKMGDFKRGDWCAVMDGLLWRFVATHERRLRGNQRLAPMVANLQRVARRRPEIFPLAEAFIESKTRAA